VLQVLTEVVCAEELLCLIALAELVHVVEVLCANVPLGRSWEVFAAIAAEISAMGGWMKRRFDSAEGGATPAMFAEMQGILMSFCFVLVFESIRTVCACVLLFGLVESVHEC
jgi:hypothetical protein